MLKNIDSSGAPIDFATRLTTGLWDFDSGLGSDPLLRRLLVYLKSPVVRFDEGVAAPLPRNSSAALRAPDPGSEIGLPDRQFLD